jgi:hypothetical protein
MHCAEVGSRSGCLGIGAKGAKTSLGEDPLRYGRVFLVPVQERVHEPPRLEGTAGALRLPCPVPAHQSQDRGQPRAWKDRLADLTTDHQGPLCHK